ncbi:MAG: DNA-primase RepB domain-containing protein, partial [Candidatus Latescibacteria bacterium]|nr:DNA-primase RepB domain-containing protein [Candidatus Latescibacterota bacterium]
MSTPEFFSALFPEPYQGFLEIRILPSGKQHFCRSIKEAVRIALRERKRNVYFGVALRSGKTGDEDHAVLLPALWADVDAKDHGGDRKLAAKAIAAFELQPSIIVDSGNGFHLYWILKEPEQVVPNNLKHLRSLLLGLAEAVGGDTACRDLSRILRVPGTRNLKDPGNPREVRVLRWRPERQYNTSDFDTWRSDEG